MIIIIILGYVFLWLVLGYIGKSLCDLMDSVDRNYREASPTWVACAGVLVLAFGLFWLAEEMIKLQWESLKRF